MTEGDLEAGLAGLERLRGSINDEVLDIARSALSERLDTLRAGELPERRLKQVTVMFVDIVGSTALGRGLDPESLQTVMDGALARFTQIVRRFGGQVLQYAGDGLLAAFGTVASREDDAEQAALAGLAIIETTRALADTVQRDHARAGFDVRVGLHTGPVLLGGGVDGDDTIRGITVSIAARMEQSAPAGRLRISRETQRLVHARFDLTAQAPITVKGAPEPLQTWLVERHRDDGGDTVRGGAIGIRSALVGRDAELASLQSAWLVFLQPGSSLCLTAIVGEAGMGKSRLVAEWRAWAQDQARQAAHGVTWIDAAAQPSTERAPYALLRRVLEQLLGLHGVGSAEQARERFSSAVVAGSTPGEIAQAQAHLLGHLLGMDFSTSPHVRGILMQAGQVRARAYQAATDLLRRAAGARPLLVLVSDLHWADHGSLDFLQHLARQPGLQQLWLVVTARPAIDERCPSWRVFETGRIDLQALAPAQREQLADHLLAPLADASPELRALLVARAEGNPYFMEALVQMLLDSGALQAAAGDGTVSWTWHPERHDPARLPTTLNGVLQARLDVLPPAEALALQQGAVIGVQFDAPALAAVAPDAPAHLPALLQRGLLLLTNGTADGAVREAADDTAQGTAPGASPTPTPTPTPSLAPRYQFGHQLMQQAAYERLLKPEKRASHQRAGAWFGALADAGSGAELATTAEHLNRAGDRSGTSRYSLRAALYLATRYAHDEVVFQATRALQYADDDDLDARWHALLARQRALRIRGDDSAQHADLDQLADIAMATGNAVQQATVAVRRVVAHDEAGRPQRAIEQAAGALALARQAGDAALELATFSAWAGALRTTGDHSRAQEIAAQGLARARALGLRRSESEMLISLAAIHNERGDSAEAGTLLRQALAIDHELGDRFGECLGRLNLGVAALQHAHFDVARAELDGARALARLLGRRQLEIPALLNLSALELALDRCTTAAGFALEAVAMAHALRHAEFEAFARLSEGSAQLEMGNAAAARSAMQAACDGMLALGMPHLAAEAQAGLARAALDAGAAAQALAQLEPVLALHAKQGHFNGTERPLTIYLIGWQVLSAVADKRAAGWLQSAWQALQAKAAKLADAADRERFIAAHRHHAELRRLALAYGLTGGLAGGPA